MRLLIVDDSKTMRTMLSSYAQALNCEVAVAEDGVAALEKLEESTDYDAILIDWDMPRMNGLELLKAIKANPALDGAKTMMVTAQSSMDRVSEALTLGADDYLMKPFDEPMVADKLRLLGIVA
jgi:two-component system chemotaxis response regulator CheY